MKPQYIPKPRERPRDFRDEYCNGENPGRGIFLCKHYETEFCPRTCTYAKREDSKKS